jgi:hypothetical protein
MNRKPNFYRRMLSAIRGWYWQLVKRVNRLAYLHHVLDCLPDDDVDWDISEEIMAIESELWSKRGYKVHVSVTDIPLPKDETSHWQSGSSGKYIGWNALRQLKKKVEDAEYERSRRKREGREMWIKWFTAIAATIGALGGLATLVNLYRQNHP